MMEWFKQLGIYLFPIVMLLTIGMNNWNGRRGTGSLGFFRF